MTMAQYAVARMWNQLREIENERPLTAKERRLRDLLEADVLRYAEQEATPLPQ